MYTVPSGGNIVNFYTTENEGEGRRGAQLSNQRGQVMLLSQLLEELQEFYLHQNGV